jgi:hypothetical protein
MKREADGEMSSPQKRFRSGDDITIRLLIPSKVSEASSHEITHVIRFGYIKMILPQKLYSYHFDILCINTLKHSVNNHFIELQETRLYPHSEFVCSIRFSLNAMVIFLTTLTIRFVFCEVGTELLNIEMNISTQKEIVFRTVHLEFLMLNTV